MVKKFRPVRKRILITGIHGFIGSSLVRFIENHYSQYEIFGISKNVDKKKYVFTLDVANSKKLSMALKEIKPDFIFHLAGGRQNSDDRIFSSNFLTTRSLLKSVEKISGFNPRIIIPGTAAEYGKIGDSRKLVKESDFAQPVSWYGFVKYMQTSLSLMYASRGLNIVVVRMFNISGVGVPSGLSLGKFAQEIALIEKGRKPAIMETKNLGGRRDFVDIADACSALMKIAERGKSGEIYNICSGRGYAVRDLLSQLLAIARAGHIKIKEDKHNSSESFDIIGSNAKLRRTIFWQPTIKIEQSLQNTLDYYREFLGTNSKDAHTNCP